MTLSRRDLEEGRMRTVYVEALGQHALTDEELSASLTATLAQRPKGAGWWVFAYGSLLWNPLFPFAEARRARVHGLHRRFCLWSLASRGRPDQPGLVLGLDRGGSCHGVVYRLPAPLAIDELHLLWRREMVTGAYTPRWVKVEVQDKPMQALAFIVRRDHSQYAGELDMAKQARVIASACGAFGSSADYLERTRVALVSHGIVDPYLESLAKAVGKLCPPAAPAEGHEPGEPPV
ncbi:MAG TPA: gamma-glutamylcyclotransferase [Casimicrobiaceae bacterium]|jgi:cation transport protein ChaC